MDPREQKIREKNYPVSAQADVEWLLAQLGPLRSELRRLRGASRRLLDATNPLDIDLVTANEDKTITVPQGEGREILDARSELWDVLNEAECHVEEEE